MLKKLTKYDFNWVNRVIVWYMLAALFFGVFARVTGKLFNDAGGNASMALLVLDKIASGLLIASCAALFINAFLRLMARFVTALYKDQSYLTHTLPAKRGSVFDAKAVSGAVTLVLSLAVIACSVLIGGGEAIFSQMKEALSGNAFSVAVMAGLLAAETVCMLFSAYLGFVLGYRSNHTKAVYGVLFTLAVYAGVQTVILLVVFGCGFIDADIGDFFRKALAAADMPDVGTVVKKICTVSFALYVAADAVLWALGRKALKKGVNVD